MKNVQEIKNGNKDCQRKFCLDGSSSENRLRFDYEKNSDKSINCDRKSTMYFFLNKLYISE